jgi:long-chain fatty acid transport protein
MNRAAAALFFAPILFATSAFGTGFGLREFSPSGLGMAYAGGAADGHFASAIFSNPALIGGVDTFDIASGATAILTNTDADYSAKTAAGTVVAGNGKPDGFVTKAVIPDLAVRYRLTDKLTIGLSENMPWGMVSKYSNDFVGRYYATKSEIQTRNITVAAAYQVLPELSIGGGVQIQFVKAALGKAIDFGTIGYKYGFGTTPGKNDGFGMMTANDWGFGYTLGILWKATDKLSIGASYRSRIAHTVHGNEKYTWDAAGVAKYLNAHYTLFTNTGVKAVLDTPAVATFSAKYKIDDRWSVGATADWTGWYSFQNILAVSSNPAQSSDLNLMDWKPSLMGSLGAEYRPNADWSFRLGTAYDATPTRTKTRIPGIPDTSRIWLTSGVGYRWDDNVDLSLAYAYMFMGHADFNQQVTGTGNSARGTLTGTSNLAVHLVGLELDYKL